MLTGNRSDTLKNLATCKRQSRPDYRTEQFSFMSEIVSRKKQEEKELKNKKEDHNYDDSCSPNPNPKPRRF